MNQVNPQGKTDNKGRYFWTYLKPDNKKYGFCGWISDLETSEPQDPSVESLEYCLERDLEKALEKENRGAAPPVVPPPPFVTLSLPVAPPPPLVGTKRPYGDSADDPAAKRVASSSACMAALQDLQQRMEAMLARVNQVGKKVVETNELIRTQQTAFADLTNTIKNTLHEEVPATQIVDDDFPF